MAEPWIFYDVWFSKSKWWIGYEDPNIHFINFPYPWEVNEESGAKFFINEIESLKLSVNVDSDISELYLKHFKVENLLIQNPLWKSSKVFVEKMVF